MIDPELLKLLCCPKCLGTLAYDRTANTLTCEKCGNVYAIVNDIPVMMIDADSATSRSDDGRSGR